MTFALATAVGAGVTYGRSNEEGQDGHSNSNVRTAVQTEQGSQESEKAPQASRLKVKVVRPRKGGLTRTTTQPGVLHAFEYADLHAKASGFLTSQIVDINDTVERGQVLVEIYDPERKGEVEYATAAVEQSKAQVQQAMARLLEAKSAVKAAKALVKQREAEVERCTAARKFHGKEYLRFIELTHEKAVDFRVSDERQNQYEAGLAAEKEALAAVATAKADLAVAEASVETADARVLVSNSNVRMLSARARQAEILAEYLKIISPYDGVVTNRNYHRGDFIRAADQSDRRPVLSVARTDRMRVVVRSPDRDIPYLDRGDEAVVHLDAFGQEEFRGKVSRFSEYEDSANRTMRVEVDLLNPTGRLREGMYGGVTILLTPPNDHLVIPLSALHESTAAGKAELFMVRGDRARRETVRIGADDGIRSEVIGGLREDDRMIVSYSRSLEDGERVIVKLAGGSRNGDTR